MSKIHMAVCIGDTEYQKRLIDCLFLYYRKEIEVSAFSHPDQMEEGPMQYHVILCGDYEAEITALLNRRKEPVVYLVENLKDLPEIAAEDAGDRIHFMEKFQSIDALVKEARSWVESEVHVMRESSSFRTGTRLIAVYALSDVDVQLGYTTTLASVLSEKGKVLVIDLQENSGYTQLEGESAKFGLEELMVMAESGEYSANRLQSCISHRGGVDFIAPVDSSECICEGNANLYSKMLMMLKLELDYEWIILSIGSRFVGFFECLRQCQEIHLMGRQNGLCRWREKEFREELKRRGYEAVLNRMRRIEVPTTIIPVTSCERLVEQWKWNELGDMIRGETRFG